MFCLQVRTCVLRLFVCSVGINYGNHTRTTAAAAVVRKCIGILTLITWKFCTRVLGIKLLHGKCHLSPVLSYQFCSVGCRIDTATRTAELCDFSPVDSRAHVGDVVCECCCWCGWCR